MASFSPGWRAGLSAARGCDKNATGLEQGRGQMSAARNNMKDFQNPSTAGEAGTKENTQRSG